jgi:exosortase
MFLLLLVPPPEFVIDGFVEWLRSGSAAVTNVLFALSGTPVLRHGYVFVLPGVAIDIAPECSGIRSALAMLIICLLAGYLYLRTGWARTVLLVATLPMLVVKNGIRIVTLTLLAVHVDPSFLTGRLHHQGGFVFFMIGLLILWPLLLGLQKAEARLSSGAGKPVPPLAATRA